MSDARSRRSAAGSLQQAVLVGCIVLVVVLGSL